MQPSQSGSWQCWLGGRCGQAARQVDVGQMKWAKFHPCGRGQEGGEPRGCWGECGAVGEDG